MSTLTLIRGLPGSGKTTLAKKLKTILSVHFEADMWFEKPTGYHFDFTHLSEAHDWCRRETDESLYYKLDVIVSNMFTTMWELKPYFDIAKKHGIIPNVILCQNIFGSIHNTPVDVFEKMKVRFIYNIQELYE
jgi:hypothetical protein